jgi:hypothetical protein
MALPRASNPSLLLPTVFRHGQQVGVIILFRLGLACQQLVEERLQVPPVTLASPSQDFDNLLIGRRLLDLLKLKLGLAHTCNDSSCVGVALQQN